MGTVNREPAYLFLSVFAVGPVNWYPMPPFVAVLLGSAGIELPPYVDSSFYDHYITEVFLYGPVGATTASVEVPEPGREETTTGPSVVDLGRPAEKVTVHLDNGQTALVRATFQGAPGEYGPTEVRTTPMINTTSVTVNETACG